MLRGLGELHLRSVFERMASQFKLEVETRPPRDAVSRDDHRQGRGSPPAQEADRRRRASSARFTCSIEPLPRGSGFEFVDQVQGGAIPNTLHPGGQKGVEQVLTPEPLAGFPLQDVRVIVYDGKHHPVDSKEVAFVAAGKKAFLDAIAKARPIVLEPIVSVEINCPGERRWADVTGDLSSRRGAGDRHQHADRPACSRSAAWRRSSELDGYAARLKIDDRRAGRVDDGAVALRAGAAQSAAAARDGIREASGLRKTGAAARRGRGRPAHRCGLRRC